MGTNSVLEFRQRLSGSQEIQSELRSKAEGEIYAEDLIEVARKHGFDITADDLDEAIAENQDTELSDFELELVSGGCAFPGSRQNRDPGDGGGSGESDDENTPADKPVEVSGSFLKSQAKSKIRLPKIRRRW